jgi:lipoprotein-releasing system permease protein
VRKRLPAAGAVNYISFRYLLGRAKAGGRYLRGAAAGIALSLIPIVVTLIVADGMIRGITDRYLELGTGHLQIYNFLNHTDPGEALPFMKDYPGLRGVWEERHGLGVLMGAGGSRGATIRAIENSFWDDEGSRKYLKIIAGAAKPESDRDVLLGEELARTIGAEVGSTVRIMTIRIDSGGRNIPRVNIFTVKGIVSSGYRELDSLWCLVSLEAGKRLLSPEASGSFLMLKIRDPYGMADDTAYDLSLRLGPSFGVYTWKMLQRAQYSSYESTRQLLLFIMALVVVVAAVNVSSATSMLVIERQRDIAIFKAGGTEPGMTSRVFLWGSFLTGLTGAIAGIAAGLLIGININSLISALEALIGFFSGLFRPRTEGGAADSGYYLETIPVIIDWTAVFLIGLFTVFCSVLASWFPARRAGKLKPIEILRKY